MKTFIKPFIDVPLLIEQLKRFWIIPALSMTAYLLFVVLIIHTANANTWNNPERSMVMVLTMSHPVLIIASVLVPLASAVALFPHHFSSAANTAFAAFPINKRKRFITNVTAGTLMFAVPLLLLSLLLLIPVPITWAFGSRALPYLSEYIWSSPITQGQAINTFPVVAAFFLRSVLTFGFYFALGIMAVSVTGNRFASGLFAGAVSILPVALLGAASATAYFYVFGYSNESMFFADRVMFYMHPVSMGILLESPWRLSQWTNHGMFVFYLCYIVLTAGMLAVGYFCCARRRAEHTGDTVVFAPLKNTLVFIFSLAGMVVCGIFFLMMTNGMRTGYYFGFAVGFVLTYFIALMVAEKSLYIWNKMKKLPIFASVALGVYLLMLAVTRGAMHGYITYVPDINDVRGVYIGRQIFGFMQEEHDFVFVTDRAIVQRTLAAHSQIIENRRTLHPHLWMDVTPRPTTPTERIAITYRLHDGRTVSRIYRLPFNFVQDSGIEALLREEAVILSRYPELLNPSFINWIELRTYNNEGIERSHTIANHMQIASLTEAMRRDILLTEITSRRRMLGEIPWREHNRTSYVSAFFSLSVPGNEQPDFWNRYLWLEDPLYTLEWLRQQFPWEY
jgi:hypothetical protein